MFEKFICWLLGHQPEETVMVIALENSDEQFSISECIRCKQTLTYDDQFGWVVW